MYYDTKHSCAENGQTWQPKLFQEPDSTVFASRDCAFPDRHKKQPIKVQSSQFLGLHFLLDLFASTAAWPDNNNK